VTVIWKYLSQLQAYFKFASVGNMRRLKREGVVAGDRNTNETNSISLSNPKLSEYDVTSRVTNTERNYRPTLVRGFIRMTMLHF